MGCKTLWRSEASFHKLNGVMNWLFRIGTTALYGWKLFFVGHKPYSANSQRIFFRHELLLDCMLYQEGQSDGVHGPRNAAGGKALSGINICIVRVISYIFLYVKIFCILHQFFSPTGISLFACSQWRWFLPSHDDTVWQIPVLWWFIFAWEQVWDADKLHQCWNFCLRHQHFDLYRCYPGL